MIRMDALVRHLDGRWTPATMHLMPPPPTCSMFPTSGARSPSKAADTAALVSSLRPSCNYHEAHLSMTSAQIPQILRTLI